MLYAPTGAKNNSLETMGEEVIAALKVCTAFDALIKPHDHPQDASIDWHLKLAAVEDEHTRLSHGLPPVATSAALASPR